MSNTSNSDNEDTTSKDDEPSTTATWEPPAPCIALRKRDRHIIYCCQCRIPEDLPNKIKLFRCSRCKLTFYCSKKCQRTHFRVHKSGCKLLYQANNPDDETDVVRRTTNELLSKGDLVFQVAYRSCDTVERGAFMFEQALDHYYNHLLLLAETASTNPEIVYAEGSTFVPFYTSIYDRVRFFLAALGHYDECATAMGFQSKWDDLSNSSSHQLSQTMQMTAGLIKMKLVASLRVDQEKLDAFAVTTSSDAGLKEGAAAAAVVVEEGVVGPSGLLVQQQQDLLVQQMGTRRDEDINAARPTTRDDPNFWPVLMDRSLFLSESTLPLLFAPNTGHPSELYCFVQDCFFLDPDIHNVMTDLIEWYEKE